MIFIPYLALDARLRPYIKSLAIFRAGNSHGGYLRNLPSGTIQLLVHFSSGEAVCETGEHKRIAGPQAAIIGQTTQFSVFRPQGNTEILAVEFFPHAAFLFFDQPISDFSGCAAPVDAVWRKDALLAGILRADSDAGRFLAAERHLLARLKTNSEALLLHARMVDTLRRIHGDGKKSTELLAKDLRVHQRQLQRQFKRYVGLSINSYARIVRIRKAAELLSGRSGLNRLDFALDQGFYDQAHFNRDFKEIVGLSPGDYYREQGLKT